MVRRTKEEALATRNLILDTAELLFQQHGVSRTSLHEIAQAAGLTRGAIYWHFKDKADLFNAMMERATLPLEESVCSLDSAAAEDPLEHIRGNLLSALKLTTTSPQARRVFEIATHKVEYVAELLAVRDRHLAGRNECLAHVEMALKAAQQRGLISSKAPARSVALGLHALVDGLIQNWMLDPEAFDLVRVGRHVIDAYLGGLKAPAEPAATSRRKLRLVAA